jgi:hypothetical protein
MLEKEAKGVLLASGILKTGSIDTRLSLFGRSGSNADEAADCTGQAT